MTLLSDWGMDANDGAKRRRNESRFQRWRFRVGQIPGALPQAAIKAAPLALNTYPACCLVNLGSTRVQRLNYRLTKKTRLLRRTLKNRSSLPLFPSVIRNQGGPEATMRPARVGSRPIVTSTLMPDLRSVIVPFWPFTLISVNGVTMNVLVSFCLVTVIEFAVTLEMTGSCCS